MKVNDTPVPCIMDVSVARSKLVWMPFFFSTKDADRLLEEFRRTLDWKQGKVYLFGKWIDEPRLSAWYGDPEAVYVYSGKRQQPLPWTDLLLEVKTLVEQETGYRYNSVLANLYRNGHDSMGWHSDNEPELGPNPAIASLNLGETRKFQFRAKASKTFRRNFELTHGGLFLMAGETQHHWQHQVPKTQRKIGERINLTFRWIGPKPEDWPQE